MTSQHTVTVGVGPVSFDDVVAVARDGAPVELAPDAVAAIEQARAVVEELAAAPTPAYGISTGFGALATRHIPTEMRAQLQRSRWSARTPPAPGPRSSARWSAR